MNKGQEIPSGLGKGSVGLDLLEIKNTPFNFILMGGFLGAKAEIRKAPKIVLDAHLLHNHNITVC